MAYVPEAQKRAKQRYKVDLGLVAPSSFYNSPRYMMLPKEICNSYNILKSYLSQRAKYLSELTAVIILRRQISAKRSKSSGGGNYQNWPRN